MGLTESFFKFLYNIPELIRIGGLYGLILLIFLVPALIIASTCGNTTGSWIGDGAPDNRPNSLFFRREHLLRTHEFAGRHGGETIILARFSPSCGRSRRSWPGPPR